MAADVRRGGLHNLAIAGVDELNRHAGHAELAVVQGAIAVQVIELQAADGTGREVRVKCSCS